MRLPIVFLATILLQFGTAPPTQKLSDWRARRLHGVADDPLQEFAGCCPTPSSRWCCRDGVRCCPPKALPHQVSPTSAPMPTDGLLQADHAWIGYHGHGLALIVEEAISGLLGTCRPLDIPGRVRASGKLQASSWDAVKIPSSANFRNVADHACRHDENMGGHAGKSDAEQRECVRQFLEIAVMHAFAPRNTSHGRAVYAIGRVGADAVCKLFNRGVRADFATATTADGVSCGAHELPALAFRWLKPTPDWAGPHLFVPRHPQGQVLVSDEFRFIFVHIPKAASTTIRALLWERGGIDNLVYSNLPAYKTATYLTFAFVRDPLRRFISGATN